MNGSLSLAGVSLCELAHHRGTLQSLSACAAQLIDRCVSLDYLLHSNTSRTPSSAISDTQMCYSSCLPDYSSMSPNRHLHRQPSKYLIEPEGAAALHTSAEEMQHLQPKGEKAADER